MRNDITIHPHERVDDLHRDGHLIIQDPKRFCFGVDAVILSGFAKVKKGENVLDLGTGTGIIPILLAAKTEGKHFTGLEIQTESAEMANRSVLLNELEERVSIKEGDIKEAVQLFGASSFDVVTSNPPYMNEGGGLVNPFAAKAIARHEILCSLEDVVAAEDTRNTLKLLNHFEIKTPMTSYHEHNKVIKGPVLVERLLAGESIALVTDAGMPGISDPGADLVKLCYAAGVPVTVAPGASAAVVALVLSGLDTRRFVFEGFSLEAQRQAEREGWESISVEEHVAKYVAEGMSEKDAMKQAAKDRGVSKREIYQILKK